ncbi:MAG: acetyl esterase [Actinomycetota bacterium]|jgi:acetyl esterase|nr:acetyl esterase [Actinomycetota bacterium]
MASRDTFAFGYYLTRARMDWFEECFVPEGEERNPRLSPLYAEDLSGLAPALVSLAIADPLRDEGEAYAQRLAEAGVPVTVDWMPMLHAWFNLTVSRSSRRGHEVLAARVNELLG